ncbi:MAG TPA: hypothetical protein VKE41_20315 [Roseiflexaceae bacterium]|nr:hypothetical protein [Roseiflexaceae bacterium]
MFGAILSPSNRAGGLIRSILISISALLLAACQDTATPAPTRLPPPSPVAFVPIGDLIESGAAPPPGVVTTAGYLVVDSAGATLVDGLSFAADGTPQLIENDMDQIWLGADAGATLKDRLRSASGLQFAAAQARGQLEGPGSYGPGGRYHYQIVSPSIELIAARDITIGELLQQPSSYEGQLVRLVGSLLTRDASALLVEQLGAGGLPTPKARQIKLRAPLRDRLLLSHLKGVSGGTIRFGQVQIEGFWHAGVLIPLSIILVT